LEEDMTHTWAERIRLPTTKRIGDADAEEEGAVVVERTGRGRKERVNDVGDGDEGGEKEKGKRISLVAAARERAEEGRTGPRREPSQSDDDVVDDEGERASRRSNPRGEESRIHTLRETLGAGKVLSDDVGDGGEAEVETLEEVPPLAEKEGNRVGETTADGAEEEGGDDVEGSAEDEGGDEDEGDAIRA
jgi:hypothetical protein